MHMKNVTSANGNTELFVMKPFNTDRSCYLCYSDAMETDDKTGSSPAGKQAETVSSVLCCITVLFYVSL